MSLSSSDINVPIYTATKTIAAIATPIGRGGIGIIRLSGEKAYDIACQLTQKTKFTPRLATFSRFYDSNDSVVDEGVVLYFKAPHSFTGEDVVELQGHGGAVLQNLLLARAFELGATQAQAGEFSYRAFENDKLDLVQAEAIADVIDATSVAAANSAMRSLTGEFSKKINIILESLIQLRLYVEASIDFPEEDDVDFLSDGVIESKLANVQSTVNQLLATAEQGQLLRDGINVVIAGRPNAGKSSLLNTLAGQERAIVTDVAGTTRDTLQESIVLNGLTLHLTDTAGLRDTEDKVERMGIERAHTAIDQADLLLLVYDLSAHTDPLELVYELYSEILPARENGMTNDKYTKDTASNNLVAGTVVKETKVKETKLNLPKYLKSKLLLIGNKQDLVPSIGVGHSEILGIEQVYVSCETNKGVDLLTTLLLNKVGFHPPENSLIARTRHLDALKRSLQALQEANEQLLTYHAGELVAESLRQAQNSLGEITGEFNADALLGRIFSSFCIGK